MTSLYYIIKKKTQLCCNPPSNVGVAAPKPLAHTFIPYVYVRKGLGKGWERNDGGLHDAQTSRHVDKSKRLVFFSRGDFAETVVVVVAVDEVTGVF